MLLGTFQGIYELAPKKIVKTINKLKEQPEKDLDYFDKLLMQTTIDHRTGTKDFGFSPVWFFPMPTLEDMFAKAAITAVFNPQFFFIYEIPENELIKLDVLKHENNDFESLLDLQTDTDDVMLLEYVINEEKLNDYRPVISIPCIAATMDFPDKMHFPDTDDEMNDLYQTLNEDLIDYFHTRFTSSSKPYFISIVPGKNVQTGEDVSLQFIQEFALRDLFVFTYFPFLFDIVTNDGNKIIPFDTARLVAISRDMRKFFNIRRNYTALAAKDTPITYTEYKNCYDSYKSMVCNDSDILRILVENGEPKRNDPCPCGSGKKWKQCHGKLRHKVFCASDI